MKFLNIRLIYLCSFFLISCPSLLLASNEHAPEIKDIIVTAADNNLLLFATVKNPFTPEMLEGVQNGIPIVFSFHLKLTKTSSKWIDTDMVELTLTHTMTFDSNKKVYNITYSYQDGKTVTIANLEQAKQLMAELNGVKIIALSQLVPDAPYAIHFKVTLKKGALPFGIHHLVPFTSLWDFETDWRTIEFRF